MFGRAGVETLAAERDRCGEETITCRAGIGHTMEVLMVVMMLGGRLAPSGMCVASARTAR